METPKNLLAVLSEWWDQRQAYRRTIAPAERKASPFSRLLPTPGNVIFTLVMIGLLVAAQSVGALPLGRLSSAQAAASTGTIAYQGRLADSAGAPLTGTYNMIFRLYDVASSGIPLWEEQWTGSNGVRISDGLFNVMLGSLTAMPQSVITGRDQLFLGITVGADDEMAPRVQLGSVPFAVQALTVPDESVTTAKIADGAVTQTKLGADVSLIPPDGSISTAKLADGAVTSTKLARNLVRVTPTASISMPAANTWYEVLSTSINLSRETLVTIHASVAPQNNSTEALFAVQVQIDGNVVIAGEKVNKAGVGNTIMMSTGLILGAGQHQIRVRVSSWQENGVVNGDARTQLVVIEG